MEGWVIIQILMQDMHLLGNFCNTTSQKDINPGLNVWLLLCTSVVAELGQGKPTRHQKTTWYLLWLWQRPSSSLYVPASRGSHAGTTLSYTHTTRYWDSRHAERSALLLPVAHRSAQAALHGGRARGLRKGVITHMWRCIHTQSRNICILINRGGICTHTCNIMYMETQCIYIFTNQKSGFERENTYLDWKFIKLMASWLLSITLSCIHLFNNIAMIISYILLDVRIRIRSVWECVCGVCAQACVCVHRESMPQK